MKNLPAILVGVFAICASAYAAELTVKGSKAVALANALGQNTSIQNVTCLMKGFQAEKYTCNFDGNATGNSELTGQNAMNLYQALNANIASSCGAGYCKVKAQDISCSKDGDSCTLNK